MKRDTAETMSKKKSVNPKAEAARARKIAAEAHREKLKALEKEDQEWRDAEGPKSRAALKREEAAQKQAEAVIRKAAARKLAEEEQTLIEISLNNQKTSSWKKGTESDLRIKAEVKLKQSRIAEKKEYERMILVPNTNFNDGSVLEADSVEEAIGLIKDLKEGNYLVPVAVVKSKQLNQHLERTSNVCAKQGKKGKSILRLAGDEQRSLSMSVGRFNLEEFEEEEEEEEDYYDEDEYREYEEDAIQNRR